MIYYNKFAFPGLDFLPISLSNENQIHQQSIRPQMSNSCSEDHSDQWSLVFWWSGFQIWVVPVLWVQREIKGSFCNFSVIKYLCYQALQGWEISLLHSKQILSQDRMAGTGLWERGKKVIKGIMDVAEDTSGRI